MSLYIDLLVAGVPLTNHESDLYFEVNEVSTEIVKSYPDLKPSTFRNRQNGALWYDAPFMYDPYWEKRVR